MVQVHAFQKCAFGKTAFELDLHHEILLNLKYSQFSQIPLFPFHTGLKREKKKEETLFTNMLEGFLALYSLFSWYMQSKETENNFKRKE